DALAVVHERGLILGGLRPTSVRVVEGRGPVIVDLARLGEEPHVVEPEPDLAPELLAGAPADRRADLHGFASLIEATLPGRARALAAAPGEGAPAVRPADARAVAAALKDPSSTLARSAGEGERPPALAGALEALRASLSRSSSPAPPLVLLVGQ